MKILYVTTVSNTINAFLIPHIKFLIEQGHEVDVACNIVREINSELLSLECKVHNIEFQRSPLKKENYVAYKKIQRLVLSEEYNLVHTHTPIASFLSRFACRNISNLKILYTAHGFHFFKGATLKNWIIYYFMEKMAAKWTDGLITINKEDYDSANKMKLRKSNSVFKVHGVGIDLYKFSPQTIKAKNELRKKYGYSNENFILFYAAELNQNKNQNMLIKVVNSLRNSGIPVKLLLAGNGILAKQYKEQVIKLDLVKNVEFLGFRKDIESLLKISDVAVASSKREGLPVNVMEAMATGLPLVVTDCRGNRDLVSVDENGYVVGIDDIGGFTKAIEKLYSSEKLRQKLGRKNTEIVKKYMIDNVIKEMEEVYSNYLFN
ncbi:MAG: glycosyltransferase family 4 protein [Halanaerobiales bacterium]|nr:glycosyltransferase family 4 protein [Halanaerobiales bacterium]